MAPLRKLLVALVTLMALGAAAPASAQTGTVTINGVLISPIDAYVLGIPDGDYWYDPNTGEFGYIGYPASGVLGAPQGMEPGYNVNTYFGGMMSDGNCAFVLGVPAGDCS